LGPNERGEICHKPRVNFSGYFGEPEIFYESVKDGWIYSGDLGYFDDEGFLYVVDRIKHMIKTQIKLTPQEIETVINEIDGVIASEVVGVYDDGIEIVYAFVIKDPTKNIDEEMIKNYVEENAAEYKRITGGVQFVEKFPMTLTGKVKKRELKAIAKKIHEEKKNN
jgi:acyl-coenzyme A synthetase/AMP-(fatty) acid ligase